MIRIAALFAILALAGCQGLINDRVDSYLQTMEDRAIRDAQAATTAVGAPLELYETLWDSSAGPAVRLKVAGKLFGDLFRNAVPPEQIVHVLISVSVMLGHQYRGDP